MDKSDQHAQIKAGGESISWIFFKVKSLLEFTKPKERGHYYMCYTYVTVFVRNAANLAHILPKASRTTFT
jgi:hypothetical protein